MHLFLLSPKNVIISKKPPIFVMGVYALSAKDPKSGAAGDLTGRPGKWYLYSGNKK